MRWFKFVSRGRVLSTSAACLALAIWFDEVAYEAQARRAARG